MKINDQFTRVKVAMRFIPEPSVGEVAIGNVIRFPERRERVSPSIRISPRVINSAFEAFSVSRQTALWEGLVFAVVELSALAAILIALVRAGG